MNIPNRLCSRLAHVRVRNAVPVKPLLHGKRHASTTARSISAPVKTVERSRTIPLSLSISDVAHSILPTTPPSIEKRISTISRLYNKGYYRRALALVYQSSIAPEIRPHFLARVLEVFKPEDAIPVYEAFSRLGGIAPPALASKILRATATSNVRLDSGTVQHLLDTTHQMPSGVFLDFLRVLDKHSYSPIFIERAVEAYLCSRKGGVSVREIYALLVRVHASRGQLTSAEQWLKRYREGPAPLHPGPFIDLLSAYAKYDAHETHGRLVALARSMSLPTSNGGIGSLTLPAYNILMSVETRRGSLTSALALYQLLRKQAPALLPDAFTFATLFKAHDKNKQSVPQSQQPRALFCDMLQVHQYRTKGRPGLANSSTISTGVLNVALRYFIRVRDYPAAIVVLRSFAVCRILPDARTHWVVSMGILRRLRDEVKRPLRQGGEGRWAERVLGDVLPRTQGDLGGEHEDGRAAGQIASTNFQLADQALSAMRVNRPDVSSIRQTLHPPIAASLPHPPTTLIPSPVPLRDLLALVQTAALAEVGISSRSSKSEQDQAMRKIMRDVNVEMLPSRWMLHRKVIRKDTRSRTP